jgi:enamine deaminase RidA (YjgF/YER057c/UK114 family)
VTPKHFRRVTLLLLLCAAFAPGNDKKKDKAYSDLPIVQTKDQGIPNQVLPPEKDPPPAVQADTNHLVFSLMPLSGKGLLSQQTREAMRAAIRAASHGTTIVKLRAFVAGSGDVRRVQDLEGEVFPDKHQPLPALSVIQAGALPLPGAQIWLEVISESDREVNPHGLGFFSAQTGASLAAASASLSAALAKAGLSDADALRVTCYVNSLDSAGDWRGTLARFSSAAVDLVQMMREPIGPAAACDAVARLRADANPSVQFLDPVPGHSSAVLVSAPKIVLSGLQMAFGSQLNDVRDSYSRLNKALAAFHAGFEDVVILDNYFLYSSTIKPAEAARQELSGDAKPPAATRLPFEGLPSLDATLGVEVAAVPRS